MTTCLPQDVNGTDMGKCLFPHGRCDGLAWSGREPGMQLRGKGDYRRLGRLMPRLDRDPQLELTTTTVLVYESH